MPHPPQADCSVLVKPTELLTDKVSNINQSPLAVKYYKSSFQDN